MSKRIQTTMVAEALSQHTQKSQPRSKKMISALMSVCTALSKPKNDLGLEQWQHIEFRKSRLNEISDSQNWRS